MKKFIIIVSVVSFLLVASVSFATDYHVTPTGDDGADGSISTPWATPKYGAERLNEGDTLFIHAGNYNVTGGVSNGIQVVSGTTIKNYADDIPFLDGGSSPTGPLFYLSGDSNVTISGFKIRGMIWIGGASSNITIENNEIYGGGQTADNFGCLIFTSGSTPNHSNITIRNNLLHDNSSLDGGGGNNPIMQLYDTDGITIEYNTIYNAVDSGIRLKDNQNNVVIRYNFFYNNGDSDVEGGEQDQGSGVAVYNNIFLNNSGTARFRAVNPNMYSDNWDIYNNTFVRSSGGISDVMDYGDQDIRVWNNIFYDMDGYNIANNTNPAKISYCNYNQYYATLSWLWQNSARNSFTDWKNASGFDANSNVDDPGFVNAAGTAPTDFKRSSYPTNGRGGNYETVIGAWISDSSPSRIGYLAGAESPEEEQQTNTGVTMTGISNVVAAP